MVPVQPLVRLAVLSLLAVLLAGCGGGGGGGGGQTREAADALPIRDDFEAECTWPQEDDETDRLACEDGHYAVVFKDVEKSIAHFIPRRTKTGYTAVAVQAETTLLQTPRGDHFAIQGIGCWASARGEPTYGYVFALTTLGDGTQGYMIARQDDSDQRLRSSLGLEALVDEEADSSEPVGSPATIRGECRLGEDRVRLALYIDSKQVATAEDTRGASEISAFVAYGFSAVATQPRTEVEYDDFLAEEVS